MGSKENFEEFWRLYCLENNESNSYLAAQAAYKSASLAAAEKVKEESVRLCKERAFKWYGRNPRMQHHTGAATGADACADAIRAIDVKKLLEGGDVPAKVEA